MRGLFQGEYEAYEKAMEEASTPMILSRSLWERSGHWAHYKENIAFLYALTLPMSMPCDEAFFLEVVVFDPLGEEQLRQIAALMLGEYKAPLGAVWLISMKE